MKNVKTIALSVLAAASLTACNSNGNVNAKLETKADSVSYALAVTQFPENVSTMIKSQLGDSTVIGDLVKGLNYGKDHLKEADKAYAMGVANAQGLKTDFVKGLNVNNFGDDQAKVINGDKVVEAFLTLVKGEQPYFTAAEASDYVTTNLPIVKEAFEKSREEGSKEKFTLNTDSLSYAFAVQQFPENLNVMLTSQFEDSILINDFIKGVKYGDKHISAKDRAYAMGVTTGQYFYTDMLKQMSGNILQDSDAKIFNPNNILNVFITLLKGDKLLMTQEEANTYLSTNIPLLQEEYNATKYADLKAENEKFLTENKEKEGVVTTESGLQYKVLTEGKDKSDKYKEGQNAVLHYEGKLIDGTVFDSSYERNEPATFDPNGVVAGFKEAILAMPTGSTWEVYIPYNLGYGVRDMGTIKPYSTLIFKIELIKFEDKK